MIQERGMHINEKELLAVLKRFSFLYSSHSNVTLLIKSDNMTKVSHINKQGGCKSSVLNGIDRSNWLWAMNISIFVVSFHISGKKNIQADSLSRKISLMKLNGCLIELFIYSYQAFFFHEVDLMANSKDAQLETFVSSPED